MLFSCFSFSFFFAAHVISPAPTKVAAPTKADEGGGGAKPQRATVASPDSEGDRRWPRYGGFCVFLIICRLSFLCFIFFSLSSSPLFFRSLFLTVSLPYIVQLLLRPDLDGPDPGDCPTLWLFWPRGVRNEAAVAGKRWVVLTVAASGPDTEGGVVGPDPGGRRLPVPLPRPERQSTSLINHHVLLFFKF